MAFRLPHTVFALLCLLLAASAALSADETPPPRASAAADANALISASSDGHLWFVRPPLPGGRDSDRPRLLHHALDMDGPHFTRGPSLSRMPEAIAASGDRVWLVFEPQEIRGEMRREVFSIRMQRDAAMGLYQSDPRDRLIRLESLPGWGRLAGFAAGADQPAALIVPLDHETFSVRREGREATAEPKTPQLWQMRNDRWELADLPEAPILKHGQAVAMAFDGTDRERLNILTAAESTGQSVLLQRDAAQQPWTVTTIDIDPRTIRSLTSTNRRLAVVTIADDAHAALAYLRDDRLLPIAQFDAPASPGARWAVNGMRDGFRLVTYTGGGDMTIQPIHPISGDMGSPLAMSDQPLPAGKLWHTGLMLAVSVVAVLIVLLVRPATRSAVQLPKHTAILPALPRLAALLIDLVPGAVLATLIMRVGPADLLRIPMMAETLDQAGPHLLMLGITFAHCTVTEWLTGTTLGKMLVGAEVATAGGERPSATAVLIRNGVKLMTLIVPPLAVIALLNPHLQGFNDIAANTVVLREHEETPVEEDQKE